MGMRKSFIVGSPTTRVQEVVTVLNMKRSRDCTWRTVSTTSYADVWSQNILFPHHSLCIPKLSTKYIHRHRGFRYM